MAVYTVMRAIATDPSAGKILAVAMRDDQDFPIRGAHPSPWRNDPSLTAGGTLIEHSVHDVDLFTWMFGPIAKLYCTTRNVNGAPGVEDVGFTQFEFAAGFHGQLTSICAIACRSVAHRIGLAGNLLRKISSSPPMTMRGESMHRHSARRRGAMERIEQARSDGALRGNHPLRERPYLSPLRGIIVRLPYALEDAAFIAALRGDTVPESAICSRGCGAARS